MTQLPDFDHLEEEIKHENDVLLTSEETLKMMID